MTYTCNEGRRVDRLKCWDCNIRNKNNEFRYPKTSWNDNDSAENKSIHFHIFFNNKYFMCLSFFFSSLVKSE